MEFRIKFPKCVWQGIYKYDTKNSENKILQFRDNSGTSCGFSVSWGKITATGFVFLILAAFVSNCPARDALTLVPDKAAKDVNAPAAGSVLYVGEIIGNDVNIRSGPGTEDYYSCGRLYKGDKVKVVGVQPGWLQIVPPYGSFSWIAMQYVSVNRNDPSTGIVTGDRAVVYVGSDSVLPLHSTSRQVQLNRGDSVKLLSGGERDDYYKISPPKGAYLWISSQYVKPVAATEESPSTAVAEKGTTTGKPSVEAAQNNIEAEKIEEYHRLQKQIDAERIKPISEQDYSAIKKAMEDIARNKEAGKAARYAEVGLKLIERYELALTVDQDIQLQNEQLQQIEQKIRQARDAKLAGVGQLGRFAVMGRLEDSIIYQSEKQKFYRIVDESGKTICYAVASGSSSQTDLSKYIGRKVGLVGTTEPHPPTKGALVRFTEIVEMGSS